MQKARLVLGSIVLASFLNACNLSGHPKEATIEWSLASTSDSAIQQIELHGSDERADISITYKEDKPVGEGSASVQNEADGSRPEVKVAVELTTVKRLQEQVDAGHTPGKLNPLDVVSDFLHHETSAWQPNNKYAVAENATGTTAIVSVGKGEIERVYLQRLVRQDKTGIWSVVGYDLRDQNSESQPEPQIKALDVSPVTQTGTYIVSFQLSDAFQPWTNEEFDHPWVKAINIGGDPTRNNERIEEVSVQLTVSRNVDVTSMIDGNTVRLLVTPRL